MSDWWRDEPVRLVQTNLREVDARRDPRDIVREVRAFGANAILFSVGGIVSFYPTRLRFQTPVPSLKGAATLERTPLYRSALDDDAPVRDFCGEALAEARALGLRFIARLDLSKCHKHVYDVHPEWFFCRQDGEPQTYNGLYSTCVNGGYYQAYAYEIMREILERYPIDGFFFNMFGYKSYDYSGNYHGLCQCDNCQRRFRDMFGAPLPQAEDLSDPVYRDYVEFKRITAEDLSRSIAAYIHQHEGLALVNYQVKFADIVRSESNNAVDRPLPMWQFSGSDNVKRVRGTHPHRPSCNAAVYFQDIPYRLASVSPHQTALRLAQDLAHGGDIDLYVLGTLQQRDRQALDHAHLIYRFAADHSATYSGLRSMAKTCLLYPERSYAYSLSARAAYRGAFRLLSEHQVLFNCAHDFRLDGDDPDRFLSQYELLVLPGAACLSDRQLAAIDAFVDRGGRVLATGRTALYDECGRPREVVGLRSLGAARVRAVGDHMRSAYWRVHDRGSMSCLPDTELVFLDGYLLYVEPRPGSESSLALVPPCTYGPPEKVTIDQTETDVPGLLWYAYGAGRTAYLPWEVDALYYRHSSPGHSGVLLSALQALLPERQVLANAGPQLEVALHSGRDGGYLLSLLNLSGHHGTAFFAPVPMRDLEFELVLPEAPVSAVSLVRNAGLELWRAQDRTCLRLERLDLFDSIRLT